MREEQALKTISDLKQCFINQVNDLQAALDDNTQRILNLYAESNSKYMVGDILHKKPNKYIRVIEIIGKYYFLDKISIVYRGRSYYKKNGEIVEKKTDKLIEWIETDLLTQTIPDEI